MLLFTQLWNHFIPKYYVAYDIHYFSDIDAFSSNNVYKHY